MQHALTAALHKIKSTALCGKGSLIGRDPDTGEVVVIPFFCKSWKCKVCAPRLAAEWRAKIHVAKPERFITLTWATRQGTDRVEAYSMMKEQFPKLVRLIRKKFGQFEYVLIWEWTEKGYPHLHILQKGDYVPQRWLSKAWSRLGCGEVTFIKDVSNARHINKYITKYLVKNGHLTATTLPFGRLIQASGHFFEPGPPDPPERPYDHWDWTYSRLDYNEAVEFLILGCQMELLQLDEDLTIHLAWGQKSKIPKYTDIREIIIATFSLEGPSSDSVTDDSQREPQPTFYPPAAGLFQKDLIDPYRWADNPPQ